MSYTEQVDHETSTETTSKVINLVGCLDSATIVSPPSTSTNKVKDQGKISELNISSDRYQTSESEGQPPELLMCENLTMDLLTLKREDPPGHYAAPKSVTWSPALPDKSSAQRTQNRRARRTRAKLGELDQLLTSLDTQLTELNETLDAIPISIGNWRFSPDEIRTKPNSGIFMRRQKHFAYCSFLAIIETIRLYKPVPDCKSYTLFDTLYELGVTIDLELLQEFNLSTLNYRPNNKLRYKSYLDFLTIVGEDSPVKIEDNQNTYGVFMSIYKPGVVVDRKLLAKLDLTALYYPSNGCYTPQSGIESDDGAKFLGKVAPKSGLPPDKPASQDAPGITTVLNGLPNAVSRVAPPKPPKPSRKDPNDGFLNGFSVGL